MTMKTPYEIAWGILADHAIQPHFRRSGNQIAKLIEEAIEADRAQRDVKSELKAIIGHLNDNTTDNPEYLRGQIEMAMDIIGYECGEDEALRDEFTQAAIRN